MATVRIKIYRHSKSATAVSILNSVSVMFGIGFFVSIFRGYKVEGILGTIISLVLAVLFAFIAARIAKNAETPKPPLERQKAKYKICRILHYSFLGLTLISFILSFVTYMWGNPYSLSDVFGMVAAFSLFVFLPVMIVFIVIKIKLKRMLKKACQEQDAIRVESVDHVN